MSLDVSPIVSVYITNFNYGRYLNQAIQSVLNQTFKDYELIIIDDGSSDGSQDVIKKYESMDNVFIVLQQNKGLNASNNIALKLARGKYIMRLDADDYLDSHCLELMVSELERHPDLALVFPDYFEVDEQNNILRQIRRLDFVKDVSLLDQPAHGACTMVRKDILDTFGGYDESFRCQDGYDLWLNTTNEHLVRNINLPLFYYRQHNNSLSRNEKELFHTRSQIMAKHVHKRQLKELSVLAILPVRGPSVDSRSLPLALLGDKCTIDWTIEAAFESQYVNHVLVTTPDADVHNYLIHKYGEGLSVLRRSAEMARINTTIEKTILNALNFYEQKHKPPSAILILYIEAPFRGTMYIDKAIRTMQLYDVDVVDGVRRDDSYFYKHNGNGLVALNSNGRLRLERDELFRRAGGLHLIKREYLKNKGEILSGRIGHIELDEKAAFLIKSKFDWQIAGLLSKE